LHRGLAGASGTAPPVLTLERWLFGLIRSASCCSPRRWGPVWFSSEALFGKPPSFNHKTVFSVLAWVLFGVLLAGRWRFGWRGRKALRWVVTGRCCCVLLGTPEASSCSEVLLGRR